MVEFIANTSPLQYLHLLGRLEVLPTLADRVLVPPAVIQELAVGRAQGLDLPDPARCQWIEDEHGLMPWLAQQLRRDDVRIWSTAAARPRP